MTALPPTSDLDRPGHMKSIVDEYNRSVAVFPEDRLIASVVGPGLVTLGSQATETGQTAYDQQLMPPESADVLSGEVLRRAEQDPPFVTRSRTYGDRDYGNVPEPHFEAAWIPVPLRPDLQSRIPDNPTCPVTREPSDEAMSSEAGYFCLYAQLAMQAYSPGAPRPPMILVVAGLLHSGDHRYVRDTASIFFSRGFSVALIDMRDHGGTFRGQPWLPTSLGVLEGRDLVHATDWISRVSSDRRNGAGTQDRFGLVGFSAGGMFSIRAFIAGRERRPPPFSEGILAISPIIDLNATLENMSDVRPVCLLRLDEFGKRSMAYYFMDLLKLRMQELGMPDGAKDVEHVSADDYLRHRVQPFAGYAGLEDARDVVTPKSLADAASAAAGPPSPSDPRLAILSSTDDPVVGSDGVLAFDAALGASHPQIGVYTPPHGGHIALAVVSPRLVRLFMRGFFDGVPRMETHPVATERESNGSLLRVPLIAAVRPGLRRRPRPRAAAAARLPLETAPRSHASGT